MSDWFDYLDAKTVPRPPHGQRKRPVVPPVPNPRSCEGMLVEESAASDSMILRVFRKFMPDNRE